MLNRFDELVKALEKQFAIKLEVKRSLKLLERQIKNLYEMMMSQGGSTAPDDSNPMFSKKPL